MHASSPLHSFPPACRPLSSCRRIKMIIVMAMKTTASLSLLLGIVIATCGKTAMAFGPSSLSPDHVHLSLQSLSLAAQFQQFADVTSNSSPVILAAATTATADIITTASLPNVLNMAVSVYRQQLLVDPLKTKVLTGITLAILGDALAQSQQSKTNREPYNIKRALSFAAFDGCYRAVQQLTYPPMIKLCCGKFTIALLVAVMGTTTTSAISSNQEQLIHILASIEQTLVSQLVIIPTVYYPVFYAVTGAVQGLTMNESIQRAKDTFVPLMKRNLLFWIPVQFGTFAFIEENLQIPILIACGLIWTIILSITAGSTVAKASVVRTGEGNGLAEGVVMEAMSSVTESNMVATPVPECGTLETPKASSAQNYDIGQQLSQLGTSAAVAMRKLRGGSVDAYATPSGAVLGSTLGHRGRKFAIDLRSRRNSLTVRNSVADTTEEQHPLTMQKGSPSVSKQYLSKTTKPIVLSAVLILLVFISGDFRRHITTISVSLLESYKGSMIRSPLRTKVVTGATLAVLGDAMAQIRDFKQKSYNPRRAASFAAFDGCYRFFQHLAFPFIISICQGRVLACFLSALLPSVSSVGGNLRLGLAALERTLLYQLLVIPLLYYPIFFTFTGYLQGLTPSEILSRAKTSFLPCWKRNLAFWIPCQMVMFSVIDEKWQIPFACLLGMIWSTILSVTAGNANKESS